MSGKKSQSSLLILLAIVAVVSIVWVLTLFSQASIQTQVLQGDLLLKLAKYLDLLKGISRNSLILSVHRATYFVAGGSDTYICNQPTPPKTDEIRYQLSNETLSALNSYLSKINFTESVLTYNISNFTCVDYPAEESKLNSGIYDEKFSVGTYGSNIQITSNENNISSKNDIFETISKDRFWFLYRKFKKWSETTGVVDEFCGSCLNSWCSCPTGSNLACDSCPPFVQCVNSILENSRKQLVELINDPYVECSADLICCVAESTECPPKGDSVCKSWNDAPSCLGCQLDRHDDLCIKKIASQLSYEAAIDPYRCEAWRENKAAITASFSCVDKKYELSVPPTGERYLRFSVNVNIFLKLNPACYSVIYGESPVGCSCVVIPPCNCPPCTDCVNDYQTCYECGPGTGYECVPYTVFCGTTTTTQPSGPGPSPGPTPSPSPSPPSPPSPSSPPPPPPSPE